MELISVIVPVYNAEKYLDRCIGSIAGQTYSELEIILVNDGSTDHSLDICKNWEEKDNRIKVVDQKNGGVSRSRNRGIHMAHGQYIVQVDSDDYMSATMIEHMYSLLKKDDSDLVICDFEKGSEENYVFSKECGRTEIIEPREAFRRMYMNDWNKLRFVVPWAKLYKKELFDGLSYPDGKIFEDIYLTHHLISRCKTISILDEKLVYYYQCPTSIMNTSFHVGKLAYLDAMVDRIDFFDKKGWDELKSIAYDEYLHSLIWEYSRARDILKDRLLSKQIINRYRAVYKKGYGSSKYPNENLVFLYLFYLNPELIILYWKVTAKFKTLIKH